MKTEPVENPCQLVCRATTKLHNILSTNNNNATRNITENNKKLFLYRAHGIYISVSSCSQFNRLSFIFVSRLIYHTFLIKIIVFDSLLSLFYGWAVVCVRIEQRLGACVPVPAESKILLCAAQNHTINVPAQIYSGNFEEGFTAIFFVWCWGPFCTLSAAVLELRAFD